MAQSQNTTRYLLASTTGDREATENLLEHLYGALHTLADDAMGRERSDHTLQPTALVHEAYIRLINQKQVGWKDRAHFLSAASRVIRQILVDHARRHTAAKRGGNWHRLDVDADNGGIAGSVDLLALDDALEQLDSLNPRQRQVVELRYFGGLTIEETAVSLSVSPATIKVEWAMARAWLRERLEP